MDLHRQDCINRQICSTGNLSMSLQRAEANGAICGSAGIYPVGDKYVLMFSPMGGKRAPVFIWWEILTMIPENSSIAISGEIDWGFDLLCTTVIPGTGWQKRSGRMGECMGLDAILERLDPTYQEGWCGFFNIPREAVLAEDNTLKFIPVKELQDLRKNKQEEADILIKEDEKKELRSGCVYETEMRINLKKSTADKIRLNLRMSRGKKTEILFDLKRAESIF